MLIPKLIHQTTGNPAKLGDVYLNNIKDITNLNPLWEYKIYSDDDCCDFIYDNYGEEFLNIYLSIDPKYGAARADLFRYLVIYEKGGLYLDIKSTCYKPLDENIKPDDTLILSHWPSSLHGIDIPLTGFHKEFLIPEFQNWFILASQHNRIIESVVTEVVKNLESYSPFRDGVGIRATLSTTGPITFTKSIIPYLNDPGVRVSTNSDLGMNYSIFKIESTSLKHPDAENKKHYRDLLIPLVKKSRFNSLLVEKIFYFVKFLHKLKKVFLKVSSSK